MTAPTPDFVSHIARLDLPRPLRTDAARDELVAALRAQLQQGSEPAAEGAREPAALARAIGRLSLLAVLQARETAQLRARWNEQRELTSTWPSASAGRAPGPHRLDAPDGELVRQVQQALDLSMDRLDVACERFRAVTDAHELRMENLRKAIDNERRDRDRSLASVHTGGAQLALHIEAEARSLRAADQQLAARVQGLAEGHDSDHARLDRLRERLQRQREALQSGDARLTELAQAVQADHVRLQRRLRWLSAALALSTALAVLALLPALHSLGG